MSWFRRTPDAPPVDAYRGTTRRELEEWLRLRLDYLDGHAESGRSKYEHMLTLTPAGRAQPVVQVVSGAQDVVVLQATGATSFGGSIPLSSEDDDRLVDAGWRHPEPDAEWRFYVRHESSLPDEEILRMVLVAVDVVLGVPDGRVEIGDDPYDAARRRRGEA